MTNTSTKSERKRGHSQSEPIAEPQDAFWVSRIKFLHPKHLPIHCMKLDPTSQKLAVVRSDFSIEIWNVRHKACLQAVIRREPGAGSIEAIEWCGTERLFSVGMNSKLTEYNLHTLQPKYSVYVASGGMAWCMAADKQRTKLAIGTENGGISIYEVVDDGVNFLRILKQSGRVSCVAWHPSGEYLVSGNGDGEGRKARIQCAVRVWNIGGSLQQRTSTAIETINIENLDSSGAYKPLILWSLVVCSDFTIICVDSLGRVLFLDGNTGTKIHTSKTHVADVFSVVVTEDGERAYVSGVDPDIIEFRRNAGGTSSHLPWLSGRKLYVHTHDVRVMAFDSRTSTLFSGGVDALLGMTRIGKNEQRSEKIFTSHNMLECACVARDRDVLAFNRNDFIDLWYINPEDKHASEEPPRRVLQIRPKGDRKFTWVSISTDASWLATGTDPKKIFLYRLTWNDESDGPLVAPAIHRLPSFPLTLPLVRGHVTCRHLVAVQTSLAGYAVNCLTLPEDEGSMEMEEWRNIYQHHGHTCEPHISCVSEDEKLLAVADTQSNIHVISLLEGKLKHHLPVRDSLVSAMSFSGNVLIITYANLDICEWDVKKGKYTDWCQRVLTADVKFDSLLRSRLHIAPTSCLYNERRGVFLITTPALVFAIDKKLVDEFVKGANTLEAASPDAVRKFYQFTMQLALLPLSGRNRYLSMEYPPALLLEKLPPVLVKKKFIG